MPDIKDIATAASYTGNAALGGYASSEVKIDPRPLELLASYTVAYNKIEREQRQKDAEKQALELSNLAAIDFSKIDPKWRDELAAGFSDIQNYMRKNPDALNYKDNKQGYFEYKRKYNELLQGTTSGKANQVLLEKRNTDIKNETDIKEKARMQKRLDADVAKTGLNQMLPVEEAYNLTFAEPVSPALLQKTVIHLLPNGEIEKNFSMRDMGKINQQALAFDIQNPLETKDITKTDEYAKASPATQSLMIDEQEAKNNKKRKSGNFAMGEVADQILKNKDYRVGGLPDGEISMDLLLKDPRTAKLANMIQSVNSQWEEQKAKVKAGVYKDPTGEAVDLTQYYPIDVKNGIDGVELARMQMWINSAPETEKSNYTNSGNQNKKDIEAMGNASKERMNTADNKRAIAVEGMGNANAITLASMKEAKDAVGKGTATPAQLEEYPIAKTREFELQIKGATKQVLFKDLTPEQRRIFKAANGGKNVDEKSVIKIDEGKISAFKANGTKITDVNLDDISKIYYDENNKNDAGKEASQRIKYDQSLFDVPVAATAPAVPEQKNGKVKETTAAEKAKAAELIKKYTQ